MTAAATDLAPAALQVTLNYIVRDGEKIFSYTGGPGSTEVKTGGTFDPRAVTMKNGRLHAAEFSLEQQGFRLVHHDTQVADFYDEDQVRGIYYPEIERRMKELTGARKVVISNHVVRSNAKSTRVAASTKEPVLRVHNDYTINSGPQRARELLSPAEAESMLKGRFAAINIWRAIRGPLQDTPLARLSRAVTRKLMVRVVVGMTSPSGSVLFNKSSRRGNVRDGFDVR